MLRAMLLGAALVVVGGTSDACSPADYDDPRDRLAAASRYYANAEWIAVGKVSSVEIVSADSVWNGQHLEKPDVIRAGPGRLPLAYALARAPIGVEYTLATSELIKGEVSATTYVRFVDLMPNEHPRESKADWPERTASGAHDTFVSCDLVPSFAVGQEVLLIKPKQRVITEYFHGSDGVEIASTLDFGSAYFRSLEPTTRNDEWYLAINAAAMLDRGGWPIGIAEWWN
ncbi:MAG: hypothetical protein Q8S09_12815 [Hyphomonas sp.]|nr:hypothetical protein [Hyphomonas sp.]